MASGRLVISLDFELYWGVRDKRSLASYRENLLGVRQAIPAMLRLFERLEVRATWATVGLLFFQTKKELLNSLPTRLPQYRDPSLSPYSALSQLGEDEAHDPFHFAPSLVREIRAAKGQELGTHTFSHFYCLELGQTLEDFRADLTAARAVARDKVDVELRSIVFPRNQFNPDYVRICAEAGLRAYRGNLKHWLYEPRNEEGESMSRRGVRLLDSYLPLSGPNLGSRPAEPDSGMIDVTASRFLRPYSERLRYLDVFREDRIVRDMERAARRGSLYHLWWHPHNFGLRLGENLRFLEQLLESFSNLRRRYGFESVSMSEFADEAMRKSS